MQLFTIPHADKYIIYRPLHRLAFIGNRAMAELAERVAQDGAAADGAPEDARAFLAAIGFLESDPPPPAPPGHAFQPTTAVLLLTRRCSLRCVYCYASGGDGPAEELSPDLARTAIDRTHENARALGRPSFELVFHGGGEPVLAWEVLQGAVAHARSKDLPCHISIVSNGIWNTRERAWILAHLDQVTISFDGRPETQDRQRPLASGGGSFGAAMETIAELDRTGFRYGIRLTATAPWRGRVAEDVGFICRETGCREMQVEPAFNTARGQYRQPTRREGRSFARAFMAAFEVAHRHGRSLTYSGARPWLLTGTFCSAPYDALIVNGRAELVSCYEIASAAHPLARLARIGQVSAAGLQLDPQARERLLGYLEARQQDCRDCFCRWHCAGDCFTRSYGAGANPSAPRCDMIREITARLLLWYIMAGDGVWQGQKLSL
jgi:uncharacterized protein